MKNTLKYILAGMLALAAVSCEKDGEILTVSNPVPASGLGADPVERVLTAAEKDNLGMTLWWKNGADASVSNPSVALPDGLVASTLQFSASEGFESVYSQSLEAGASSVQFTVETLNNIVLRLGITEETATKVYVRVATTLGKSSVFSEAVAITVTPYIGDAGAMNMNDKDSGETFATIHNTTENPDRYEGFVVTTVGWQNFYFVAADGSVWGEDAAWTPFVVEKQGDEWRNCWFAGTTGCHYVVLDTKAGEWWQVHFPSVVISAEGNDTKMKFSTSAKTWSGVFTTTADNVTVKVGGTGAKYDRTVGTDASATPIDWPFTIAASEGIFNLVEGDGESNLTTGAAGTYTLTFNIDTQEISLTSGGDTPPPVNYPEQLYAWYYKKEASDKLDMATVLNAVADNDGQYQGFLYTSPDWTDEQSGFRFLTTKDDDATVYYTNSGQYELTTDAGGWNFWSGAPGLNYVTVDLTAMTWAETKATFVAVVGDFNKWQVSDNQMTYDTTTRKWIVECNIPDVGDNCYGFHFVIGKDGSDWEWQFCDTDGDGVLSKGEGNFKPAEAGNYRIELDLSSFDAPTYTLTKKL